ncbi:hypothetical protein [Shimia sp.]|uniref:hypothetical protein n=1 Tax=Shimia sp. TaxID=1954381 RepID=UPI003297DBFB
MPLEILLVLVVGGIAGITVILHRLGLSRRFQFENEEAARTAWLREIPDRQPTRIILSPDRMTALIMTDQGPGLAWSHGADTVARPVSGCTTCETETGLRVEFNDIGTPRTDITLPGTDRQHWLTQMRPK